MKPPRRLLVLLGFVALAGLAKAEGHELPGKKSLNLEGAKRVAGAAVDYAKKNNAAGVIAIVDDGGYLIYLERVDNTFPAGALISYKKARTAALFRRPTRIFEEAVKNGRTAFLAAPEMTPLQGGVPILAAGQVVGAIGVSGASSAQQDKEIALAGARVFDQMVTSRR